MAFLGIETPSLNSTGKEFIDVATEVREIFTKVNGIVDQVTSNDSWRGETSNTFLEKFNEIKPKLETHLQQLEALGPAVKTTADDYAATEEANDAMMRTL